MARETTKGEKQTLIEQGTEFTGTMKSTCPVVVNGRIEGDLTAPELDITASGTVQGNIKADRLSSRGKLSGNIDAGDLYLSGSVGSKTVIKAKNLEVKLSPDQGRMELTIGECTLDVGDEPTKERRIESNKVHPSLSSMGAALPVTRSEAPSALVAPEAASIDLKAAPKDSRNSISKPPGKKGASDSIPPGA